MLPVGGQTGEQDKAQGDIAEQCSCLLWNSLVKGEARITLGEVWTHKPKKKSGTMEKDLKCNPTVTLMAIQAENWAGKTG